MISPATRRSISRFVVAFADSWINRFTASLLLVRDIYVTQIMEFFKENVRKDGDTLNRFCNALQNEDVNEYNI